MRIRHSYYTLGAAMTMGMMAVSSDAHAANNWGNVAKNITSAIQDVPGLISSLSYLFGVLLGVLGIMKIKDHVENPSQTPLKEGAIRLAAGGALFALPIIYEAMFTTVGAGNAPVAATMNKVQFNVL